MLNKKVLTDRVEVVKEMASKGATQRECAKLCGITEAAMSLFVKKNGIRFMTGLERAIYTLSKKDTVSLKDIREHGHIYQEELKKYFGVYRNIFDETGDDSYKRHHTNRLYHRYIDMIQRCKNSTCNIFKYYGAKGITVCDEWIHGKNGYDGFDSFALWALWNGYEDGLKNQMQLDRIDNTGNYSPDNCRWTDPKTNINNRSTTIRVADDGNWLTVSEYANQYGIGENKVRWMIKNNRLIVKAG